MMWRRTLALLILAATAACAGSAGTTEQTLRVRLREDPPTIDPAFVTDQVSATVVRRLHAGLVDFDPETLEIVPRVAERWDISDDGTIYTFHLRKGVLFHNGREVTAEDAAWSLRRLVDPATLLIQRETQRRLVTQQVPISAELSGVLKINETKEYAFEYTPLGEVSAERP